jgi:FlaA1/EpsC-like NDP-sugar epimerase
VDQVDSGKVILLTGAGGSIGSALAKAILASHPEQLILLDNSERNLNQIDSDLSALADLGSHTSVLGDICDARLLSEIFQRYRPKSVYHAAAFKHVPLMETNPFAAVRNNAIGTESLARVCKAEGVANLVMISTDKAVNPISIMGASKRVAELALLNLNSPQNHMSAVRLGNVWGSHGSVVPTFLNQISRGGPITVTHPEVSRYFLGMEEAVDLILLASELEEGGVFIPQLFGPVKILDMAHELVRKFRPRSQKEIVFTFTGLRAGDKMAEEFLYADESVVPTADVRLFKIAGPEYFTNGFDVQMKNLSRSVDERDLGSMIETICQIVPDYRPTELLRNSSKTMRLNR